MCIVTLTTDIGQQDFLVGAIKGQLLTQQADVTIVDITHYLSQANYPQAAYVCANAFKYFPANTCHIIILNFFETAVNHLLIAKLNDQFIICADNGIITMITGEKPTAMVAIPVKGYNSLLARTALIAKAVSVLSKTNALESVGYVIENINEKYPLRATVGADWMEGQILFIDNFENVVINITQGEFEEHRQGRQFKIVFKRDEVIDTINNNYASVVEGEKMAWFNSAGYLEIAINKGNMAGMFGLQGYNEKMQQQGATMQNKWFYQTVRIFFE
ncbi:MAG: SAM-dependent chlorinase/fluorinase [Deinococcales bacterium]|nr:SAM-dependent chlorinase/fluorinase [Chitinophagaceae bacterium]